MKKLLFLVLPLLALCAHTLQGAAPTPTLDDFLKDYSFDEIKISPDGSKVAALSAYKDQMNLYVIDLKTKQPKMLTGLTSMGLRGVMWVGNERLLFSGKKEGYGTGGIFAIDVDGKNSTVLVKSVEQMAKQGAYMIRGAAVLGYYGDSTTEVLIVSPERNAENPDVYRMNVRTGSKHMVALNPGKVEEWIADRKGAVRVGFGQEKQEQFLFYRDGATGDFRKIKTWHFREGKVFPISFDAEGRYLYVESGLGRDTSALCKMDPTTGEILETIGADDTYDAGSLRFDRVTGKLLGYTVEAEKTRYVWLDPEVKKLQTLIDQELPDTDNVLYSRSDDASKVVILSHSDRNPGTFYFLNTKTLEMEKLVSRAAWLKREQLSEMRPISYKSRDGLVIHGYLTLPAGQPAKNLPLIVNPHGGPWVRDEWGYNFEVQYIASLGYAVLQMNYRGSTGYGKKFLEAGYGQWGLAMQDDITDGVKWAIAEGYADPSRIGIYGGSYGGYACMAGLAFTPELYRCGINYVGVTDISLLLKTIPESWERMREDLENKTGNAKLDRNRLDATSPLKNADRIKAPVFFVYGEQDERVDIKHGTRMAAALKHNGVPVEWMSRVDEGHGYRRPENKKAFYAQMGSFLAKYMGPGTLPGAQVIVGEPKVTEMPAK